MPLPLREMLIDRDTRQKSQPPLIAFRHQHFRFLLEAEATR
jgi:hypothetical protein